MQSTPSQNKAVANWLLIGVVMIIIQVLIGGITRLTESGLSITEWKPFTGALPPLNDAAWQTEFEKYRSTDQFKYVHQDFSMRDFKFIFFWEWFHRQWARLIGLVFIAGFIYLLVKKKLQKQMIAPLLLLFVLGGLQGGIGWIMVKSGLVPEKYFVGHIELTTHFIAALILLAYTMWFAISMLPAFGQKVFNTSLKNWLMLILALLFIQLMYGGFMAGLRAAATAPTWPDINGKMIPAMDELSPWMRNLVDNPVAVHFIHRGIAYMFFVLVLVFYVKSGNITTNPAFKKARTSLMVLVLIQVLLGIFALLNATYSNRYMWLALSHQFIAMMIVMNVVVLLFLVRKNKMVVA